MTAGGAELRQFYGIQQIPADGGGVRCAVGMRVHQSGTQRGPGRDTVGVPREFHGKNRPGDYTDGCIAERSEQILWLLFQLDIKLTSPAPRF